MLTLRSLRFTQLLLTLLLPPASALASDIGLFRDSNGGLPQIVLTINPGTNSEVDLTAAGNGTTGPSGVYDAGGNASGTFTDGDSSYFAGVLAGLEFRDYFLFDESSLTPGLIVSSAQITLDEPAGGFVGSDPLRYSLHSIELTDYSLSDLVSGQGGVSAFTDLGDGLTYASTLVPPGSQAEVTLSLDDSALALITAEEGQGFAPFGGTVSDASAPTPEPSTLCLVTLLVPLGLLRFRNRLLAWTRRHGMGVQLNRGAVKASLAFVLMCSTTVLSAQSNCGDFVCPVVIPSPTPVTFGPGIICLSGLVFDPDSNTCVAINSNFPNTLCIQSLLDLVYPRQQSPDLEQVAADGMLGYMISNNIPNFNGGCNDSGMTRLRVSNPNQAAAAAFLEMMVVIQTPSATRKPYEQNAYNIFTNLLKTYRVNSAQLALDEYNVWKVDPCHYQAPAGLTYTPPSGCFSGNLTAILASPDTLATPPDFVEIGTARAFGSLSTGNGNFRADQVAQAAGSFAAAAASAYVATGTSAGLLTRIPPQLASQINKVVFPFTYSPAEEAAAIASGEALSSVFDFASKFAGPIGIVISAVEDLVFSAIDIVKDQNRGKDMQQAVTNAQNATIDLTQEITTTTGMQQLYGIFIDQVNLTPVDAIAVPALYATFTVTDQNFTQASSTSLGITYRTWDQSVWDSNFIFSTGWWEHAPIGTTNIHNGGYINYIDWEGRHLTASFSAASGVFLVTGYPQGISSLTDALYVLDANNVKKRYVLNNPATGSPGGLWTGGRGVALKITTTGGSYLETSTLFRNFNGVNYQQYIGLIGTEPEFGSVVLGTSAVLSGGVVPGLQVLSSGVLYTASIDPVTLAVSYKLPNGIVASVRPTLSFQDPTSGQNLIGTFTP